MCYLNETGTAADTVGSPYTLDNKSVICKAQIYEAITEHVYQMLTHDDVGLKKIFLHSYGRLSSFVYGTRSNFEGAKRLLILIDGSIGVGRAGQWSRTFIIQGSLDHGTQIPYIREAITRGYDVLVTNTNYNTHYVDEQCIVLEGSATPEAHITTVWKQLIQPVYNTIESFAVIAHNEGVYAALHLAKILEEYQWFLFENKCIGIALIDSNIIGVGLSLPLRDWLKKVSC